MKYYRDKSHKLHQTEENDRDPFLAVVKITDGIMRSAKKSRITTQILDNRSLISFYFSKSPIIYLTFLFIYNRNQLTFSWRI